MPYVYRKKNADWITDEVKKNLSWKSKEAWLYLQDISSSDSDQNLTALAEYCRFMRLTKVAGEKLRNAWRSVRAVEAEKKTQQLVHGGSIIKELRLLKNQSKPSSS